MSANSFAFQIDEWTYKDGGHMQESVSYLVLEAGWHTLADGTVIEAGVTSTDHNWKSVSFSSAFGSTPVVLSQVSTRNGGDACTTRQKDITNSGFAVVVQEEEAKGTTSATVNGPHVVENVSWVAISAGSGEAGGLKYQVAVTPDEVTHKDNGISFGQSFTAAPGFFAQMQKFDGWNTAVVRYRSLNASAATVFIEEEQSADSEREPTTESLGWLVIEPGVIRAEAAEAGSF